MHWHWASGYKFMRAGVETVSDSTFLHLGSSRCEGTIGDIRGCASDNRPHVVRQEFSEGKQSIDIDLAVLFAAEDLTDGQKTECMSGPAESHCPSVFSALGLDFASGKSTATPESIQAGSIR